MVFSFLTQATGWDFRSLCFVQYGRKSGVFPGEQLVVIITPSFISMRFPMYLWTLKWKQTSDVLRCTIKPLNQHVTHRSGLETSWSLARRLRNG